VPLYDRLVKRNGRADQDILPEGEPDRAGAVEDQLSEGPLAPSPARSCAYHFLTPVWGKAYTATYLELVMPAQLSAGNLGAFAGDTSSRYIIYTTQDDAQAIRASPAYHKLRALMPVVIEIIDHEIVVPHDSMSICFREGIAQALAIDAAVVFLTPDLIFADGSFGAVKRLCESGRDVIFNPGIRTIKQGVTRTLLSKYAADGVVTIGPRDLMRVALDNIHPLSNSSWWEEGEGDLIPANLYWRVGAQGILSHCFHLHPLLVRAQRKNPIFFGTVDDDYVVAACPDASRDHVVVDSDEILMIEVSDATRFFVTGFRKGSIEDTSCWAEQFANTRHRALFPIPVKMHAGITDARAWAVAERRAKPVVEKIRSRMARPTWRLAKSRDSALTRRLWRISQDQELAKANGFPIEGSAVEVAGIRTLRLTARLVMKSAELARKVRSLSLRWRRSMTGGIDKPTLWTMQYLLRRARARDFKDATAATTEAIVVYADPASSLAVALLRDKAQVAVVVSDGDKPSLLFQESSQPVPDASCDALVLDCVLPNPRQVGAWLGEFARVVRPGGKLVVVANRFFDASHPSRPESCAPVGAIEAMVQPEFSVVSSRVQGALGSVLVEFLAVFMHLLLLRSRPLRIVSIFLGLLFLPIYPLVALLANGLAFVINRVDKSGQVYASSIVVGERKGYPAES
jgi:hypothetical protein